MTDSAETPTRSRLFAVAALLTVCGVIAGPGYGYLSTMFSGNQAGTLVLPRASHATQFPPLEIDLTPDMNPVGLVFDARIPSTVAITHSLWNQYRASLYLGDRRIMDDKFTMTLDKDFIRTKKWSRPLDILTVPAAGRYRLVFEELSQPQIRVLTMQIEFRRNVIAPNRTIVTAGFVAMIAGMVSLVLIFSWPSIVAYFQRGSGAAGTAQAGVSGSVASTAQAAPAKPDTRS